VSKVNTLEQVRGFVNYWNHLLLIVLEVKIKLY